MPVGVARASLFIIATLLMGRATVRAQTSPVPVLAPVPVDERAQQDDEEARNLFQLGKQNFDEGRFERALKYFQDAYDLSRRPALLSNIGSALDRLRRDREALAAYQSYLEQVPDAPNRAFVEGRIRVIEGARANASPPTAAPDVAAPAPVPVAPTPEETAHAAPASRPEARAPVVVREPVQPAADSGGVTSRWWFWASLGAAAAAAVVVGVAASSSGGTRAESPALASTDTHVRAL